MKLAVICLVRCAALLGYLGLFAGCQTTETPHSQFGKPMGQQPSSALGRFNNTLDQADDKIQDVLWGPKE